MDLVLLPSFGHQERHEPPSFGQMKRQRRDLASQVQEPEQGRQGETPGARGPGPRKTGNGEVRGTVCHAEGHLGPKGLCLVNSLQGHLPGSREEPCCRCVYMYVCAAEEEGLGVCNLS